MNERLGHYDIVEELGRGGMGVVYKGYESSLGRYVAIKVLAAAMAHDPVFVERFLREARAMAALNDPHIIQIYFIGQDEDQTFFVMEFIDGESLSDWIKRENKLAPSDALKILMDAAQGLATAHAQGVIHRDIKPGNIMITTRGVVKVADFGIALASNDVASKLTNTGALVGTPGYLSPEVCLGKAVDQRSDIFALGIVLFEMLTGHMPFNAESPLKLMLDVVEADIPDIREINPNVDEEVKRILLRMLAKNPVDRYQSCDALIADLKKHPLVIHGGPLQLRQWTATDASKATMVGLPTPPSTPNRPPRLATPPPQVSSSRTQQSLAAQGLMQGNAGAATAPGIGGAVTSAPAATVQVAAPSRGPKLALMVAAGVVAIAVIGFVFGRSYLGLGAQPAASTTVPVATAPISAPAPPQPPVPAPQSATANTAATDTANPSSLVSSGGSSVPTANDGAPSTPAGATNTEPTAAQQMIDVRTKADEALAREATRRKRLAAAAAAAERRQQARNSSNDEDDSSSSSSDDEGGGSRVSAAEARRKYLCRIQKKC
jgi:serine/threonine-protein kinase